MRRPYHFINEDSSKYSNTTIMILVTHRLIMFSSKYPLNLTSEIEIPCIHFERYKTQLTRTKPKHKTLGIASHTSQRQLYFQQQDGPIKWRIWEGGKWRDPVT